MRKHSGYLALNIAGLTIGLTSFLLITLYVLNELSYDRFHKNYENIYRIKVKGVMAGATLHQAITSAPMAQTMRNDFPDSGFSSGFRSDFIGTNLGWSGLSGSR